MYLAPVQWKLLQNADASVCIKLYFATKYTMICLLLVYVYFH